MSSMLSAWMPKTVIAAAAASFIAVPAMAADLGVVEPVPYPIPVAEEHHGVEWTIVPFNGWLPGMNGTVSDGVSLDIDLTPVDILENIDTFVDLLDGLYIGSGHVGLGKFGFLYDVFWMDVGGDLSLVGPLTASFGFSQFMGTAAGTYRFHDSEQGHIDAVAGLRFYDIAIDVGVGNVLNGGVSESWVDPMIGLAGRYNFNDRWYVNGWGMIGGFGVGSDFTWDVWGNVGYQWHDWLDVYAGIRATGADYSSGSFNWDITQYGPVMGAALKF